MYTVGPSAAFIFCLYIWNPACLIMHPPIQATRQVIGLQVIVLCVCVCVFACRNLHTPHVCILLWIRRVACSRSLRCILYRWTQSGAARKPTQAISMTIYIQYMYPMFTQISHIHSHLLLLIAEATPCFCLVFTTRAVSEMELEEGGSRFNHDVSRT